VLRILLDENLPIALKALLFGHDVGTVRDMGWLGLENGALLDVMEREGFSILITADKSIPFQQALADRGVALVVLSTNHWPTIRAGAERIMAAVKVVSAGSYYEVDLERSRQPGPRRPGGP
jgi:hypothetical protein